MSHAPRIAQPFFWKVGVTLLLAFDVRSVVLSLGPKCPVRRCKGCRSTGQMNIFSGSQIVKTKTRTYAMSFRMTMRPCAVPAGLLHAQQTDLDINDHSRETNGQTDRVDAKITTVRALFSVRSILM
eukprot:scaffold58_cov256-Pinguiococcus_pyrenoidosus.AAC.27